MKKPRWLKVLEYLETHETLTPLEAWRELGIYGLAKPIWELRMKFYNIKTDYNPETGIAVYSLVK